MIVSKSARVDALFAYIGRPLALLFLLDTAIAGAYVLGGWTWLALPDVPLSIFGGVISVIAGFRNASAYARWWEARTVWGAVVNSSRTFARQVLTMVNSRGADPHQQTGCREAQRDLILLQIAYVRALRNRLREPSVLPDLSDLINDAEIERLKRQSNVPLAIQQTIASILARCYANGWIDTVCWVSLDRTLGVLMDCQGASERIKHTPMPRMYDAFIRLFIDAYCILLPLGMVASLGLWTPLGSTLGGFMFLALDKIGRDLEAPFDNCAHDIPLTAISRTIEINLKQMLGEEQVPEPAAAVEGVLW